MDNAKEYLKSKNIFINERVGEDNLTENSHLLHELLDEYAQQQVKNTVDLADVSKPVCPKCFDTGKLRNDREEIIGVCPCHY